jgi:hypothetical protein
LRPYCRKLKLNSFAVMLNANRILLLAIPWCNALLLPLFDFAVKTRR